MKDASISDTEWCSARARQIRILRLCRLPLVLALLVVGAHGGMVTFERLGWSAPPATQQLGLVERIASDPSSEVRTSTTKLDADDQPESNVGPASGSEAKTVGEESAPEQGDTELYPEEITGGPDMLLAQTDQGMGDTDQELESPVLDSMGDSQMPRGAEQVVEDRQSPRDRDLTSIIDGIADSGSPLSKESASPPSDGVPKTDEDPEVTPVDERNEENTEAVSNAPSKPPGNTVVLSNDTEGVVHYLVNGEACSLSPGETHNLGSEDSWSIQFHRGGDFGNAEHTISQGVHAFRITESGWDLQRASIPDFP